MQTSLDQTKSRIAESSKSEIELRALEREARANRALLESFLGRFKATGAQEEARFQQPDARVVSRGEVPDRPAFPQTLPILAIALIVALLIGAMIALIQEQFERGFRSAEQIERLTGVPGLGFVPWLARRTRRGLTPDAFMVERPSSAFAESIRSAYAGIVLSRDGRAPRSILVTSAQSDEGKTAIALSLARLRAMASSRVVIVDADLRAPAVHERIRIARGPGLSDVLRGAVPLDEALRQDERTGAYLLSADGPTAHPSDLLAAPAMRQLLDTLASRFDLVVIDSPPVRAAADARILSNLAEVTLFIVRWGRMRREVALQALRQIEVPGRPLRVLVSMVDVRRHARYGFGDSGYYFGHDRKYYAE
ncbi:MAG: hypothetical protein FJX67_14235 [Alphaproteobacteria bacterium]|nr:hypothetical protein [Alphaproteobacteria bacterium]